MATKSNGNAIVVGGSIAGLLAAQVLSERFGRVTVIERDVLPPSPEHRRRVPQSRHIHALLARGREAMESLFPGFAAELLHRGGSIGDPGKSGVTIIAGQRHCARATDLRGSLASRLLIEDILRKRVRSHARIELREGAEAVSPILGAGAVKGLTISANRHLETLTGDLLIDCSGRRSPTPGWLIANGLCPPVEEELRIDIRYRSRLFRLPAELSDVPFIIVIAATPKCRRGGVIAFQEDGYYLCTLVGYQGEACPDDLASFLEFARRLPTSAIYDVLLQSEPVGASYPYGMRSNLRRRYERLTTLPQGLLVMGDAVCSFDPTYGQGMTVAALEALDLQQQLRDSVPDGPEWFRRIARIIDTPWTIAVGGGANVLGLPQSTRGIPRLINRYLERLHARASTDPTVADAFMKVAHLYSSAPSLLRPSILWRVLRP